MSLLLLFNSPPASQSLEQARVSIESADWTGIEQRSTMEPETLASIERLIKELEHAIESAGLTNSEKAKAQAMTSALASLVASSQPEWELMALLLITLLGSPFVTAALNAAEIVRIVGEALNLIIGLAS